MISGAGTTYTYDGSGERVMKPGKLYWKGVGSTALAETDATDHNPTQYIFFNGARIARIDAGATTPKYYIADHLGSTALVTDSLGNILNESLFFPYGVERVIQQNDSANNYKFTGKERDAETGLDDFGARYYVSTLGRFMSPDWDAKPVTVPYASFGDPQTLNLYSYVENAPLNKVDADGHGPPDSNPSFGGNSLEHYYFGLDGVNDAACAELNGCGEEEQAQRQTEESGDEAAYVERVQDSAAQQTSINQAPQYSAQSWESAVATAQTIQHVGEVVYQETRPMSDNGKANVPLTTAREMIADVYLNGNHNMALGTNNAKSSQEKAALSDSIHATINAVMNRQFHNDITGGAKKYNQSPNDHSGRAGGGAFCPNSCPIKGSYGPYLNANPKVPVEHYINIYN